MELHARDIFIDPHFEPEYRQHPLVLADVGARGGLKKNWQAASPHLRVLAFEPDEREYRRLAETAGEGGGTTFFHAALNNTRGSLALHITKDRGLSSIFPPNRPFINTFPDADRFDTTDVVQVAADTLDSLLAARGMADVDFIKADTQGSELFVLQGAARTLASSVAGVEVEVEFTPIYTAQPLFADVDAYLRGLGYLLFDLRPCYWKRAAGRDVGGPYGQIIWADALYLKSVPALETSIAAWPAGDRKSKWLRAMSVAVLYGYYDYALELVRASAAVFTGEERALIERRLRDAGRPRGPVPPFPGRGRVAGALRKLWKMCRLPNEGWSVSDAGIGNVD